MRILHVMARQGPVLLVLGLIAGASLPEVAQALRPYLPLLVALLLFLTAIRVGHRRAFGSVTELRRVLLIVLCLQLVAPLLVIGGFAVFALPIGAFSLAVVLMLAAPSVTGAPNFLIMMGHEPSYAMRILVVGTALFPFTVIPVILGLPALDAPTAIRAGVNLTMVILGATALGFAVRSFLLPNLDANGQRSLDGLSALALSVIVVGLMSEIGTMLRRDAMALLGWASAVLALNFGLQIATYMALKHRKLPEGTSIAIISGNRNIALFLIALPPDVTGPLLTFIGCYQIPMYLTPIIMRYVYRSDGSTAC